MAGHGELVDDDHVDRAISERPFKRLHSDARLHKVARRRTRYHFHQVRVRTGIVALRRLQVVQSRPAVRIPLRIVQNATVVGCDRVPVRDTILHVVIRPRVHEPGVFAAIQVGVLWIQTGDPVLQVELRHWQKTNLLARAVVDLLTPLVVDRR